MKPLPTTLFGSALLWCALHGPASAQSLAFMADPADFVSPTIGRTFADGTPCPWTPPPLPPLPAADLWEDYRGRTHDHHLHVRRMFGPQHQPPLLTLVGDVLDGFFSLLTFPARKVAHHRQCHGNAALSDCGCYPPPNVPAALPAPAWIPDVPTPMDQSPVAPTPLNPPSPPPLVPAIPRNVVPQPMPLIPAIPVPAAEGEGLPLRPAEITPVEPALIPSPQLETQRLYPGRAPVVELAPDPILPPDQALPPRNRIPSPADRLPKNVIPPR
jgi:hypothetical protein